MKALKHFKTITTHKYYVAKLCFAIGLYKQGLLHDLTKYMPCEFMTGVKYYQGNRSPNTQERLERGFSLAWLHHKGANRHHWEFWVDFTRNGMVPAKMPYKYILEMFCDRTAASIVYKGKDYTDGYPLVYYNNGKHSYIMHPVSRRALEHLLHYLNDYGLDETLKYIKQNKDRLQKEYDLENE